MQMTSRLTIILAALGLPWLPHASAATAASLQREETIIRHLDDSLGRTLVPCMPEGFYGEPVDFFESSPGHFPTKQRLSIACCYVFLGKNHEAVELLKECLVSEPKNLEAQFLLGSVYSHVRAHEVSVGILTNVLSLARNDTSALSETQRAVGLASLARSALLAGHGELLRSWRSEFLCAAHSYSATSQMRKWLNLALIAESIMAGDRESFWQVASGLNEEDLATEMEVVQHVQLGCTIYPGDRSDTIRAKVKRALPPLTDKPLEPTYTRPLTQEQTDRIRRLLGDAEAGKVDLYEDLDQESCQAMVVYALHSTNSIPTKAKLGVARCLGKSGQSVRSAKLAEEYVRVCTNDWRGWRTLGFSYWNARMYDQATVALSNAVALGGIEVEPELASSAAAAGMVSGKLEIIAGVASGLVSSLRSARFDTETRLEALSVLTFYAIATGRTNVATLALGDLQPKDLFRIGSLRILFLLAWERLHLDSLNDLWGAYREAVCKERPDYRGKPFPLWGPFVTSEQMENRQKLPDRLKQIAAADANKDWDKLLNLLSQLDAALPPEQLFTFDVARFKYLLAKEDHAAAYRLAEKLSLARMQDARFQNSLAWYIATSDEVKERDLKLAEEVAQRAIAAGGKLGAEARAAHLDTLARIVFTRGERDRAIKLQRGACELATGVLRSQLEEVLKAYEKGDLPPPQGNKASSPLR